MCGSHGDGFDSGSKLLTSNFCAAHLVSKKVKKLTAELTPPGSSQYQVATKTLGAGCDN